MGWPPPPPSPPLPLIMIVSPPLLPASAESGVRVMRRRRPQRRVSILLLFMVEDLLSFWVDFSGKFLKYFLVFFDVLSVGCRSHVCWLVPTQPAFYTSFFVVFFSLFLSLFYLQLSWRHSKIDNFFLFKKEKQHFLPTFFLFLPSLMFFTSFSSLNDGLNTPVWSGDIFLLVSNHNYKNSFVAQMQALAKREVPITHPKCSLLWAHIKPKTHTKSHKQLLRCLSQLFTSFKNECL